MNKKNREIMIRTMFRKFPVNFLKTIKCLFYMARRGEKAASPYKIHFESTAICNLKCRMCPQNSMKRAKGHLKFGVFKKIYNQIKPPYLNLTGFGEPLLNPDIFKIIKYAKINGSFVKLDTNGTLLTPEKIKKLLDTGIDVVSNSIDGIDKKTYEKIRIGANFEKVMDNLKNFVNERDLSKSKTEIHLYFVLQKDNFLQFPKFIKFGNSLGIDSISGYFIGEENYGENAKYGIEFCKKSEIENFVAELKKLKKEIKANLEIDEIIEYTKTWKEKKNKKWGKVPCYKPWYSPFITWDGFISPCCYCGIDKVFTFGDLTKEKFKDVWNGEKIRRFRKMTATNRAGPCVKCEGEGEETYIKKAFKKTPILSFFVKD